ncbi:MAG: hypothetical protein Q8R83_02355 [Legionellaceae bacterium]|nr:hypothetical protein [Legionellaceae bacterium]
MSQDLSEIHFFRALQTEVIAIKNVCGPGGAYVNNRYPRENRMGSARFDYQGRYPDDRILRYHQDIQSFVGHTVIRSDESTCIYQDNSYRASAYQVVYNIAHIFINHIKSNTANDEFDLINITDNFNALKRHRYNPSAKNKAQMGRNYQWVLNSPENISYFVINNDVGMYLLAKRLHRCLTLNPDNPILKQKIFRDVIKNLADEIGKYDSLNQDHPVIKKYPLFCENDISKEAIILHAESEFVSIYKKREELSKSISTSKLIIFAAIRFLSILSVIAGVTAILLVMGIELASVLLAMMAVMAGILMVMCLFNLTYLPLSISAPAIQKNTENYNELRTAIINEFGSETRMQTPEQLIQEGSLKSGPEKGDEQYWLSLVTPSWTFS